MDEYCRMEDLNIKTWSGITKCLGAILCVGGALSISLYKGMEFHIGHYNRHLETNLGAYKSRMLRGTCFLIASCCCSTAWFIMQVCLYYHFSRL